MKDTRTFEERWEWIISYMVLADKFVHYFLMMMDKVKDNSVNVFSVKVDPIYITLKYNEEQIKELSDQNVVYLLTHEIYHIVLHHCTIRRYTDSFNDAVLSEAQELVVNSIVPEGRYSKAPCDELGIPLGIFPVDYDYPSNLSSNQYYNMLKNDIDKMLKDNSPDTNPDIMIIIPDSSNGSGKEEEEGEEEEGEGSGDGEGEGEEEEQQQSGGNDLSDKTKAAINKLIEDINNNKSHLLDDHSEWEESNIVDDMIRNKVHNAMSHKDVWGSVPGNVQSIIEMAQESKVSWERYLKYHIGNLISPNYERTITKPDKRFGYPYLGKKRVYSDKKLVAIDTSGSISDDNLTQFLAEINKLVELMPVDLVLFDTNIQLGPVSFHRKHLSFDFKGRGGTNFQPVFDLAVERRYQSVIILTDGCAASIEYPEGVKDVLWVLTDGKYDPPVDWGERVHIEE